MKKFAVIIAVCLFAFTACSGDAKPSKDSMTQEMTKALNVTPGLTKAQKDQNAKYAECVIDSFYDDLPAKDAKVLLDEFKADKPFDDPSSISLSKKGDNALNNADTAKCEEIYSTK